MAEDSSDSDESDDGGNRVKNVRCFLVASRDNHLNLDEAYAYKQKLGELIFDANFETGNLGFVEQIDEFEFELSVRADVCNSHHRCWFNFIVKNQRANQSIVLTFVNISEVIGLFNEGLTPVVRNRRRPNWKRLHPNQVFYYESERHNNQQVLSIAFKFFDCDNEHQFALFYPYNLSQLTSFINRWQVELKRRQQQRQSMLTQADGWRLQEMANCSAASLSLVDGDPAAKRNKSTTSKANSGKSCARKRLRPTSKSVKLQKLNFSAEILAETFLLRPIYKLSIYLDGDSLASQVDAEAIDGRPKVVIIRQSSGNFECQTAFVCQGFLDLLLSQDPIARAARRHFGSVVFPMLDPDSVCAGNSRTDIFGQSTISRPILEQNPILYKPLLLVYQSIEEICTSSSKRRVLIIDLRMNPNLIGARLVGTSYGDTFRMESHLRLARLLSRFSDGFYIENCIFRTPNEPLDGPLDFRAHNNVDQFCLEISPFAYYKRTLTSKSYKCYNQNKYLLLGKSLALSLLELFRPKKDQLDTQVAQLLDSFHIDSKDIDDVTLSHMKQQKTALH